MTTNFTIRGMIAQNQIDVLLSMLKSWNIDAEVEKVEQQSASSFPDLSFSTDLWVDYDIDDKSLRAKAWGTNKRNI